MGETSNGSSSSSLSPVSVSVSVSSPSSIVYVDLYGKRRQLAKVQVLEREINVLQDEIKSLAELELASRCCKELEDFVEATPDPLVAIKQSRSRSRSCWKNFW
ncbi:guanine nucleotide-binding protein subunit gamma 3-like [Bidens hawaiensis]|uniref:guanine nucleotide-binding protein subunit gamma 3-like n=1 Tax=Bidens hawaiensis TaxID=980011 RepID=UPI00404B63CB